MTPSELYQLTLMSQQWSEAAVVAYDNAYFGVEHEYFNENDPRYTKLRDMLGVPHGTSGKIVREAFKLSHGTRKFTDSNLKEIERAFADHRKAVKDYNKIKYNANNQQNMYSLAQRRNATTEYERAKQRGVSSSAIKMKLWEFGLPSDWCFEDVTEFYCLVNNC